MQIALTVISEEKNSGPRFDKYELPYYKHRRHLSLNFPDFKVGSFNFNHGKHLDFLVVINFQEASCGSTSKTLEHAQEIKVSTVFI